MNLIYAAKLSSGGGGNVNVTELENNLGGTMTWEETDTGEFRGASSVMGVFPSGRVRPFTWANITNDIAGTIQELDENRVVVYERNGLNGEPQSGPEIYVEIGVFPLPPE